MRKVTGAVVGLGYWGPNLVRNFIKIPSVQIKTVCDLSATNLRVFSQTYPHIPTTKNLAHILEDPSIEFIAIATPLKSHFSIGKQALSTGKHVLLEKPMTSNSKEAKELVSLARKKERILMVGHTFVYAPAVKKIKEVVRHKSFGDFLYFDSTRINLGRFTADTNVIWDLAPHDFSILHFLLDKYPSKIQVIGSPTLSHKTVDISHIYLTYEGKTTAHIHTSWLSPVKIRNILVGGSKKMVMYDDIQPSEKIRIYNSTVTLPDEEVTPFNPLYRSGNVLIPHLVTTEALFTELNHFVDCIIKQKQPLTDGIEGQKTVQMLEAADLSLKTGKAVSLSL